MIVVTETSAVRRELENGPIWRSSTSARGRLRHPCGGEEVLETVIEFQLREFVEMSGNSCKKIFLPLSGSATTATKSSSSSFFLARRDQDLPYLRVVLVPLPPFWPLVGPLADPYLRLLLCPNSSCCGSARPSSDVRIFALLFQGCLGLPSSLSLRLLGTT
jgi:hypothetical protein